MYGGDILSLPLALHIGYIAPPAHNITPRFNIQVYTFYIGTQHTVVFHID